MIVPSLSDILGVEESMALEPEFECNKRPVSSELVSPKWKMQRFSRPIPLEVQYECIFLFAPLGHFCLAFQYINPLFEEHGLLQLQFLAELGEDLVRLKSFDHR